MARVPTKVTIPSERTPHSPKCIVPIRSEVSCRPKQALFPLRSSVRAAEDGSSVSGIEASEFFSRPPNRESYADNSAGRRPNDDIKEVSRRAAGASLDFPQDES